jgi:hypothetical protein
MIRRILSISALAAAAAFSQEAGSVKAALQQRLGEVKQSIAQNQARLRHYAWTETTEISLKGEEKKRTQAACQYGPDGKVQKTAIGAAPPPPSRRGIKGKIVTKKIDEMKDYMDRVGSLMRRYIPPAAQDMQAAFQVGKATLNPASGELVFSDYAKPGDKVTLTFDVATKKLRSFSVMTYLDEPKDTVTMDARFSSLPDGTNFVEQSVLDASAKQIQITTTNFGYQKVGG